MQIGAEREPGEAGVGEDDAVPVAGGGSGRRTPCAGPSRAARLSAIRIRAVGIELEPLAGELLEHVVGDDDRRLGGRAEAAQLHGGHDHRGGLAGADGVGEQRAPVGEDAGDGVALVLVRGSKLAARPGRVRWLPSWVGATDAGEQLVVAVGEAGGPVGVLPHPGRRSGWRGRPACRGRRWSRRRCGRGGRPRSRR